MFIHFIILASLNDKHVAYHFSSQNSMEIKNKQKEFIKKIDISSKNIKSICGTHTLPTQAEDFDSVKLDDPYFEPFKEEKSIDKFIAFIFSNIQLTAFDIASYLFRKNVMLDEFSLQKMLYYIYSDYLLEHKISLFKNDFVTFRHKLIDPNVHLIYQYKKDKFLHNVDFEVKLNVEENAECLLHFINKEIKKYELF